MKAAPDFKIFWDNAYMVHTLMEKDLPLFDLFGTCKRLGTEDRVLVFCSHIQNLVPRRRCRGHGAQRPEYGMDSQMDERTDDRPG